MEEHATQHAMTEIALGLAMAFFAIMVLAMVSMAAPSPQTAAPLSQAPVIHTAENSGSAAAPAGEVGWLIYYRRQLYDQSLKAIDRKSLADKPAWVLAVPPDLSLAEILAIKGQLAHDNVTVTSLDKPWLSRLAQLP